MDTEPMSSPNESLTAKKRLIDLKIALKRAWVRLTESKTDLIKKRAIFLVKILLLACLLIFLARRLYLFLKQQQGPVVAPSPQPTGKPEVASPSAYATDSAVLKTEQQLMVIEELLKSTRFRELPLLPPKIDLNVSF